MSKTLLASTPLPARDFNQELEKTRGAAHALEAAAGAVCRDDRLITDKDDPSVQGLFALIQVLADRLDDLCVINDDAQPLSTAAIVPLRSVA